MQVHAGELPLVYSKQSLTYMVTSFMFYFHGIKKLEVEMFLWSLDRVK